MSGYYAANPHFDGSDISVDQADRADAAERHDQFLLQLVEDEYWHAVRGARAIYDHEVGVATDKFAAGLPDFIFAIGTAQNKFNTAVVQARLQKPIRLAQLRANDEVGR